MYKTPKKETPYKGSSINHVRDQFLGIFDSPPLLHSWSFLLNNTYEIDMSFGYPPPSSTIHVVYAFPITRNKYLENSYSFYLPKRVLCAQELFNSQIGE